MAQDHDQRATPAGKAELDRADLGAARQVGGNPDHEQSANRFVEDDLRRNPTVGTAQDDRVRVRIGERGLDAGRILYCTDCVEESRVAGPKQIDRTGPRLGPRLLRPDHALLSSAWPKSSHRPLWVPNPQVPLCVHGRSIPAPIPYVRYDRSSRPEVGTLRRERG